MAVLRVEAERLGTVSEVRAYLQAIEQTYNGLYAFDLIVAEAKGRASTNEPMSWRYSGRRGRVSIRSIRRAEAVVLPEDRLRLRAIAVQSPGFWEFVGALNALETLRKYLADRHERRKDVDYRNRLDAERMALDNQKLKIEVVKNQVELLRTLGVPDEKIREALTAHVALPLERLDSHQDAGLI